MSARRLAAALLLVALTGCPALRTEDERARDAVAALRLQGFTLPIGARQLAVPPGAFDAVNVTASTEAGELRARGQVSLEGRLGETIVSYLGGERFEVRCGRRCVVVTPPVERLEGVLAALLARDEALRRGDRAALLALADETYADGLGDRARLSSAALPEAPPPVTTWLVRVDRDRAEVGEARGAAAPRPASLVRGADGWRFTSGLP